MVFAKTIKRRSNRIPISFCDINLSMNWHENRERSAFVTSMTDFRSTGQVNKGEIQNRT